MANELNSLAPGRCGSNFKSMNFRLIIGKSRLGTSYEVALWWMPENLTDDKSKLVQLMAWWCQATSHYLSQCWHRSMLTYGVIRAEWMFKGLRHVLEYFCHNAWGHMWTGSPNPEAIGQRIGRTVCKCPRHGGNTVFTMVLYFLRYRNCSYIFGKIFYIFFQKDASFPYKAMLYIFKI